MKAKINSSNGITPAVWALVIVFVLGLALGIQMLLAKGIVWCVQAMFHYELPYWPTVLFLLILGALFGGARSSKS